MAEKVFKLNDKVKSITRSIDNLYKGYDFQEQMGKLISSDTSADITSEDYDPSAYFAMQKKILSKKIEFLSPFFVIPEKDFGKLDPVEVNEVCDDIYLFLIGNVEADGETSGED